MLYRSVTPMNTRAWGVDTHTRTQTHTFSQELVSRESPGAAGVRPSLARLRDDFPKAGCRESSSCGRGQPSLTLIPVCGGWWGCRHTVQHQISRSQTQNSLVTLSSLRCPEMPTSDGPGGPRPFLAATSLRIRCREIACLAGPLPQRLPLLVMRGERLRSTSASSKPGPTHSCSPSLKSVKPLLHWGISSHQGPTFF